MSASDLTKLAEYLTAVREKRGWSTRQLANLSGVERSNIVRLEAGQSGSPRPPVLAALARTLDVPLADLYLAAGIEPPGDLPTFTPYLRSKYKGLPTEAHDELRQAFERITTKYGYAPNGQGPGPGEDETAP